ncbi:MAG: hypothetical protein GXY25_21730 [Pirellulaceae bacterium]|jgi:hypothetical protein|nr:hypothetical protein [Thermoguttaceae bacterium]NLZ03145.1 hypothetical protein [Pirellulaceae bacterium]
MQWKRRPGRPHASLSIALAFFLFGLALCGCSTFRERPGHGGFFGLKPAKGKASASQGKKVKSSWSLFRDNRPRPSESVDDFLNQERVDW